MIDLSRFKKDSIITIDEVAREFKRHPQSVRRAVTRGELPAPVKILNKDCWIVESLLMFIQNKQNNNILHLNEINNLRVV